MTPIANPKSEISDAPEREPLPLSLLNDFLYCPRRAALKIVEGWREANEHTERGDIVHEHADLPGYESLLKSQITLLRALPVWSERLGLTGKCDIVEAELCSPSNLKSQISALKVGNPPAGNLKSQISDLRLGSPPDTDLKSQSSDLKSGSLPSTNLRFEISDLKSLKPVEFKLGKRRQWENDDAQLCAQALCLEEMFGLAVPRGAVFHADSKRRREVEFTAELRQLTENTVAEMHTLLEGFEIANVRFEIPRLPAAVFRPACAECSLFDTCLPKATGADGRAQRLARDLFKI